MHSREGMEIDVCERRKTGGNTQRKNECQLFACQLFGLILSSHCSTSEERTADTMEDQQTTGTKVSNDTKKQAKQSKKPRKFLFIYFLQYSLLQKEMYFNCFGLSFILTVRNNDGNPSEWKVS